MNRRNRIIIIAITFFSLILIGFAVWIYRLNQTIVESISNKRFIPPIEFYSAPQRFFKGQKIKNNSLVRSLSRLRFRERRSAQVLNEGDYMVWDAAECTKMLGDIYPEGAQTCIAFRNHSFENSASGDTDLQIVAVGDQGVIFEIFSGNPPQIAITARLEPELFAQFIGPDPIIKVPVDLGDTPPLCLNAVLAIEDSEFLEHKGISVRGIVRAFLRNMTSFRVRQGASTITQQLVKNYFLTHERTFRRKFKEIFMAILLENYATKDDILQSYINEIYMGQNGSFQVRGFGAAAEYYFGKSLGDLDLADCALMAALVNSPGMFNPFKHPQAATTRKELVLNRMTDLGIIDLATADATKKTPLPKARPGILSEPAPFFVDAVQRQLDQMKIDRSTGLRIFTTLDLEAQEAAQLAVKRGIERLEKDFKKVRELKEQGKVLEGTLMSSDPTTGYVQAIVGGRSFKQSQFNRAVQSHRQVGSIIKPFVFLAALEGETAEGKPFDPLTLVNDDPYKIQYDKQKWSPENYEKKYFGDIPMFFALRQSLNAATARISMQVGLQSVIDLAQHMGIKSTMRPVPSLALGSFELYAWEVLQSYGTLARLGEFTPVTFIESIESLDGGELFRHKILHEQVAEKADVAVVIGMLKDVIDHGTGRSIRAWGFNHPAAGKTGTTNDNKDAWFAGFTPLHVAVSWVGYDDNTPHGLTGASGGIPIWADYMMNFAANYPPVDFAWPSEVEVRELDIAAQTALGLPDDAKVPLQPINLVFKKSQE
jgi:penicillin-binding protein 1B